MYLVRQKFHLHVFIGCHILEMIDSGMHLVRLFLATKIPLLSSFPWTL